MTEVETPPVAPPEQPPVAPEKPASLIGADGALVENWQKQAPEGYEDLREDKTLSTIKNIWDFGKSHVHMRKQVPMDKMPRPTDTWEDADWDEFYKAGGRPDTKEDYKITYADEIPEEMRPTKEVTEKFQEIFHKHGASKELVDALTAYNNELTLAGITKTNQDFELAVIEVQDALRKDWGLAYEQNVHRGNVAIDKDKDAEKDPVYKTRLLEKINKDPDLIRFASNMGYKFVEAHIVEDPGIPSQGDLQQQITDLMADPKYTHKDTAVRQPLIDKVLLLRRKLNER